MRLFDDYQGLLAANSATLKADIAQGVADIEAAWTCPRRRASPATYDRPRRRVALKFFAPSAIWRI